MNKKTAVWSFLFIWVCSIVGTVVSGVFVEPKPLVVVLAVVGTLVITLLVWGLIYGMSRIR